MSEGKPIDDWGARIPAPRVLRFGTGLGFLLAVMLGAVVASVLAIVLGLSVISAQRQPTPHTSAVAPPASSDDMIYIDLDSPEPSASTEPR